MLQRTFCQSTLALKPMGRVKKKEYQWLHKMVISPRKMFFKKNLKKNCEIPICYTNVFNGNYVLWNGEKKKNLAFKAAHCTISLEKETWKPFCKTYFE